VGGRRFCPEFSINITPGHRGGALRKIRMQEIAGNFHRLETRRFLSIK